MTATADDDLRSGTLGVNVFTAPGKSVVGERPRPFGEPLGGDPITSTLIYGEYDAGALIPWPRWPRPRLLRIGLRCITAT